MTLYERAVNVIEALDRTTSKTVRNSIIIAALKEQDKITRHASAEDVICLQLENIVTKCGEICFKTPQEIKDAAHAAVMNCRGGVE